MMGPCRLSNNEILSKYHSNCSSLPDKYTSVQVAIWQDLVDEIVILHYLNFCETPNKTFTSPITPPNNYFHIKTGQLPGISANIWSAHFKGGLRDCTLTLSHWRLFVWCYLALFWGFLVTQWQRAHLLCRRFRFSSWVGKIPWRRKR